MHDSGAVTGEPIGRRPRQHSTFSHVQARFYAINYYKLIAQGSRGMLFTNHNVLRLSVHTEIMMMFHRLLGIALPFPWQT